MPRLAVATATIVAAVGLPAAAGAAWAPPVEIAGPGVQVGVVTSGEAGRVAVGGTALDGTLFAATHTPGGTFGAAYPVAAGSEDFLATLGNGGAIAALDGGRPTVRRLRPDGSVSAPVNVGGPEDTIVGRPAVAPGGALLVLVTDVDGDAELWRQPGDGQPATALAVNVPDGASVADIAATGSDSFVVGLAAPNINEMPGVRVRTILVPGATGAAGAPVETTDVNGDAVNDVQVVPGPQPAILYTLVAGTGSSVRLAAAASPAPRVLATAGADEALDGIQGAATAAGFAASWTLTSDAGVGAVGFAVLPTPAQEGCRGTLPFEAADVVDRAGPAFVGLDGAGAVGITTSDAACVAPAPVFSAPVADAGDLNAGVDADGTVLALVGRGEAGAAVILPDDVTPPLLGAPSLPAQVREGTAFAASVAAADPWGLAGVEWKVDGQVVAQGESATIPGLTSGTHRVDATGTNAAGLTAARGADVVAFSDPAPPPPPPPAPPPPPPPSVPGVGPDTVAPVISDVRLLRSLLQPTLAPSGIELRSFAVRTPLYRGTTVRFTLSEASRMRLSLYRLADVPRLPSRCLRAGAGPRLFGVRPPQRLLLRELGQAAAGRKSFAFSGWLGTRRLGRGRYELRLVATDASGNRSKAARARLTLC